MQHGTYYVFRSTTDKLEQHLNHIAESGDEVIAPTFVGGRDWVILCRKGMSDDEWAARYNQVLDYLDARARDRIEAAVRRGSEDGAR